MLEKYLFHLISGMGLEQSVAANTAWLSHWQSSHHCPQASFPTETYFYSHNLVYSSLALEEMDLTLSSKEL